MKNFRKNQGITLIALVITVIVLLILAGVTIATLTGDNGILTRAQQAKNETEQAEKEEKEKLGDMEDTINEYTAGIEVQQVTDENPGVLEGTGTDTDPYTIESIEDLVVFASNVTNGTTYEGKTVKLGLSLDFNSNKSYVEPLRTDYVEYGYDGELKTLLTTGEGFKPIGARIRDNTTDELYNFKGSFDGNGNTLYNLYINTSTKDENNVQVGLFSINYGTIKNIGICNCNITIKDANMAIEAGAVAGRNCATIENSYTSGKQYIESSSTIHFGGISGAMVNGIVQNCYSTVNLSGKCEKSVYVYVGGIVGVIGKDSNNVIDKCYNVGSIDFEINDIQEGNFGGIISAGTKASISNSYNCGNIKIKGNATGDFYIGGAIGNNNGIINNFCNIGNIISDVKVTSNYNYVGAIVSVNNSDGKIENTYYLKDTCANGIEENWGNETDVDTLEIDKIENMPAILEIIGTEFREDENNINNGYPILTWQ